MKRIHIATGLAVRGSNVLLVASRYPSHELPLWNLPGGRQEPHELLTHTVAREIREETGLSARVMELAYLSESYDGDRHITNVTFRVDVDGVPHLPAQGDHIVEIAWLPIADLRARLMAAVARDPLLAYLGRKLDRRYAGFPVADTSIRWDDEEPIT